MMTDGIRTRLKTITKPLHDEIELNRLSKAIAAGTIDMDSYILFLSMMLAFIEPIEDKIRKVPFWTYSGLDSVIQARSLLLKEDLEYLGGTTHYGFSDEYMPHFDCPAGAYGVMYVLEGSMVGASVQTPMAAKALGLDGEGMRYLTNGGNSPMGSFGTFLGFLEGDVKREIEQKKAILAACDTFMSLKIWLDN